MKHQLSFIFLLLTFTLWSQNTSLDGKVTDDKGNPLEMANVIAINTNTGKMESYSVTNGKGMYQITLSENTQFNIKVSYMGFNTETLSYVTQYGNQKATKNFILKEKSGELAEVEIKYSMPVTVKGDTIVYNTDSFTTGNEKKLEDVIKKLPGMEINDDGQVEVEGKQVSKVMVNGKDFFDGDSKLATKNIPADKVEKVEVLKKHSEVSQMSGLENDQDAIALNIKLKQGKESFWFGELTAGGGLDEKYVIHPKVFYYSPKKSLNILTDFNNMGQAPFTMQDYFKFSGGFKNMMKKGGSSIRISSDQLGISLINNDRAYATNTKFGALNFNYSLSDAFDISGFAIANDAETETRNESQKYYILNQINELQSSNNVQRNQLGMLKISTKYKPKSTLEWNYDAMLKKSKQTDFNKTISNLNGNISTNQSQNPFTVNQNSDLYYTLNDKNIFSVNLQHYYDQNAPLYSALSENEFFSSFPLIDMQSDVNYQLTQDKYLNTNKIDAKLDYFNILNNKSNLNLTLGNTFSNQSLDSKMFQTLTDNSTLAFENPELKNEATFKFNDLFLALHYNLKKGKLKITPGFSGHIFYVYDRQFNDLQQETQTKLLPDFFAEYQFKSSRSLTFQYSITNEFSDIKKYAIGLLLNSYQSLSGGSREIESSLYHNYSLRYADFNMYNFTNIFGNITYKKSLNPVKTTTLMVGTQSISYPVNLANPDENISGNLNMGKKFKKWGIDLSGMLNYGKNYNLLNDNEVYSKSFSQYYNFSLETRFKNAPNFELGYNYNISDYMGNTRNSTFTTQKPYLKIDANFLKNFTWTADYSYYNYQDEANTVNNHYSYLSSKLYYQQKDSKWEFILSGDNMLKTGNKNQNSNTEFFIYTSKYIVQPAVYMLTVKYDL